MSRSQMAGMLQTAGLLCLVTGAAFFSVGVAFIVGGVGLVLWGVSVERGDS